MVITVAYTSKSLRRLRRALGLCFSGKGKDGEGRTQGCSERHLLDAQYGGQ